MGVVLTLVKRSNKDTVEALQYMLSEAQCGRMDALNVTYKRPNGEEEVLCTGEYKTHPELVVMAALRLSVALLKASGELERE